MKTRLGIAFVGAAALAAGVVVVVQRWGRGGPGEAAARGAVEPGPARADPELEGPGRQGARRVETGAGDGTGDGRAAPAPVDEPVETVVHDGIPVEVLAADGAVAAGVEVLFALHDADPTSGRYWPRRTGTSLTAASGRAWIVIAAEDRAHPWLEAWARDVEHGLLSEARALLAPWPAADDDPVVLRLRPAGSLRVRVLDASLAAASGAEVRTWWLPKGGWNGLHAYFRGKAGEDGVFVLPALRPGPYGVSAGDERIGRSAEGSARVEWGRETLLELVLSDSDLPLAVEGTLVDEEGRPLADVHVGMRIDDSDDEWWMRTDLGGRFAWYAAPGATVRVRARPDEPCECFEPEEAVVSFGERNVVLRRSAVVAEGTVSFRVVDEVTGEPAAGAQVWVVYDQDYDERRGSPSGADGIATVELCLREGAKWGIHAPGYLEMEGRLAKVETDEPVRVALRRGFDRWVQVVDWYAGDPLPGAVLTDGAGILAVADGEGLVHLVGSVWPERLEVTRVGYRAAVWEPARRLSWKEDFVGLQPLEDR